MSNPADLGWGKLIRVKSDWIEDKLLKHGSHFKDKITTRTYSIRFASTHENMDNLITFMVNSIEHYVLSDDEIKNCSDRDIAAWWEASKYFGAVDPSTDGKSGELLLYLLVEKVLETPMIAHKIKSVSDAFNDQVKGSDGVFFGLYKDNYSLLFGESKIYKNLNDGTNEALESMTPQKAGQKQKTSYS